MAAILAALVSTIHQLNLTPNWKSISHLDLFAPVQRVSRIRTPADHQLAKPDLHPLFPSNPHLQPFKFLISVGGFLPTPVEPDLSHFFPLPASLKTLHIIGKNDIVVTEEKSLTLVRASQDARLEYHDGGGSSRSVCNDL